MININLATVGNAGPWKQNTANWRQYTITAEMVDVNDPKKVYTQNFHLKVPNVERGREILKRVYGAALYRVVNFEPGWIFNK